MNNNITLNIMFNYFKVSHVAVDVSNGKIYEM